MKIVAFTAILAALLTLRALCAGSVESPYPAGSVTAASIDCRSAAAPAADPTLTFSITNRGTSDLQVWSFPIFVMVHLTIKESGTGKIIPQTEVSEPPRSPRVVAVLKPGQTIALKDWPQVSQPATSLIPLSMFGYHLASGNYIVSASTPGAEGRTLWSSPCAVTVP